MLCLDDATLLRFLKEDVPYGDLTTRTLIPASQKARMTFQARQDLCLCGAEEAARLLELTGCQVSRHAQSGDHLNAQDYVLEATGPSDAVFMGWKVSQTLVEWASGVASAAANLVQKAKEINPDCVIACTRKAVPGTRELSARAILSAKAVLHRNGLSDTLLLFPEHRCFGDAQKALHDQITHLLTHCPERHIVVEVKSEEEAHIALAAGAHVIQLEKFSPEAISSLIKNLPINRFCHIAAAGGINGQNVEAYAQTGADILVTSSPYYAKPADIQVNIAPIG